MIQQEQKQNKFRVVLRTVSRSLAIIALFLLTPLFAQGAILYFEPDVQEIGVGQQFQVDISLNAENEAINAVEGKIVFPGELLELKEIRDGNSIINFWVERPKTESNNQIIFSGITPGGYIDKQGLIFSTIFQSKNEGKGTIEIQEAKTLLNDGKGTEASLTISNFQFLISKQIPISQIPIPEIKDTDPPEDFKPEVASDPTIFDGKWFLVFATQDKGSGVDHYEVKETRQRFLDIFSKWVTAESPYILRDQELRSYVFVKAVDKAGNERIIVLPPQKSLSWYENYWILGILIMIGLIVAGISLRKILWKKNTK